jgi:hypothetical protein
LEFVLALQRSELVEQIEDDRNPRDVNAEIFPQSSNRAQSRHSRSVEKHPGAFARAWLDQPAFDKTLDQRGVDVRMRREQFEG